MLQLIPESLFLAIYILDRFLSKQEVERKNLQLVCSSAVCSDAFPWQMCSDALLLVHVLSAIVFAGRDCCSGDRQ